MCAVVVTLQEIDPGQMQAKWENVPGEDDTAPPIHGFALCQGRLQPQLPSLVQPKNHHHVVTTSKHVHKTPNPRNFPKTNFITSWKPECTSSSPNTMPSSPKRNTTRTSAVRDDRYHYTRHCFRSLNIKKDSFFQSAKPPHALIVFHCARIIVLDLLSFVPPSLQPLDGRSQRRWLHRIRSATQVRIGAAKLKG